MLNTSFLALADPTRRAILARLAQGEASVNDLAAPFTLSQPAISQHIKVLEKAGLILRRVDGTRRPCRIAPQGLAELNQWLAMVQQSMAQSYARLDAILAEDAAYPPKEQESP